MKQTLSKSKSKKGEEEPKKKNQQQERKKKDTHEGNTHTSASQGARGGCSAETKQQNNRIRHEGKQGSENESEEGDTRNKRKNFNTYQVLVFLLWDQGFWWALPAASYFV